MAALGTPDEGKDELGTRYLGPAATDVLLIAYTNAADSLGANSVLADIVQPSVANGYAAITLDGTWSFSNGVFTYLHGTTLVDANPNLTGWASTGSWSGTVNGVALVTSTTLQHFHDLAVPFTAANGKKLGVDLQTVI